MTKDFEYIVRNIDGVCRENHASKSMQYLVEYNECIIDTMEYVLEILVKENIKDVIW